VDGAVDAVDARADAAAEAAAAEAAAAAIISWLAVDTSRQQASS
jgi:hypothetical protein